MITTVHGFGDPRILPAYRRSRSSFVSISDADRAPGLPYLATVHHGLDLSQFPLGDGSSGALVAFGRIHPDKATADAIEIARRAGLPLHICGPVHDAAYFESRVAPFVDGVAVRYLGNVGPAERASVLGGALALLHPLGFDEPFGLSVVEAMACGTPVIGYPRGALPETVSHGVTGFLVDGVDAAVAAVPLAIRLDRNEVFAIARQKFSAARMVDDYLRIYQRVTQGRTTALGD
jgi:glycosyltransferase involved in cell wall biosynthesis